MGRTEEVSAAIADETEITAINQNRRKPTTIRPTVDCR